MRDVGSIMPRCVENLLCLGKLQEANERHSTTMNILGIDPANRLGAAHSDGYRDVIELARGGDVHPGQRLIRFSNWLEETLDAHKTELIAAEDASFGSHNPAIQAMHNQLLGVLLLVAAEYGIEVKLFFPGTIKAFATGNGRADKSQMVWACKTHFGIEPRDDNEADAIFILELAKRPDCWPQPKVKKRRVKTLPPQKRFRF